MTSLAQTLLGVFVQVGRPNEYGNRENSAGDAAYDFHLDTLSVVTASTCHAQTNFDTILRIYKKISGEVDDNGDPLDTGQEIANSDDGPATGLKHDPRGGLGGCYPQSASKVTLELPPGDYVVVVDGSRVYEGTYELSVDANVVVPEPRDRDIL